MSAPTFPLSFNLEEMEILQAALVDQDMYYCDKIMDVMERKATESDEETLVMLDDVLTDYQHDRKVAQDMQARVFEAIRTLCLV